MSLLYDALEQPLPFLILVLTALVAQNEINLAESRRRRPCNFGVFAWPFVIQDTFKRPQFKSSVVDYQRSRLLDHYTTRLLDYKSTRLLLCQITGVVHYYISRLLHY